MNAHTPNGRILGLDLARALAVIGMILVNYKLAMNAQDAGPGWMQATTGLFEGRASALFVTLAGIGVALMTAKARASEDETLIKETQRILVRRAMFLFGAGLILLLIGWSADILHYYAVFLVIAALLIRSRNSQLLVGTIGTVIVSILQLFMLDYSYGWSENYHQYELLWTWSGFTRNLLFNGFHPIFPWLAFFLLGMWVGRTGWLTLKKARARLLLITASAALITELTSTWLVHHFASTLSIEGAQALFGTKPMPPNPIYLIAAASSALAMLVICIEAAERWRGRRWVEALISTGQLTLTHYVAHVMIGLAPLQLTGLLENGSVVFSTIYALVFYAVAIAFSFYWKKRHGRGPLEQLMRRWE